MCRGYCGDESLRENTLREAKVSGFSDFAVAPCFHQEETVRIAIVTVTMIGLAVAVGIAAAPKEEPKRTGVLSVLRKDMKVGLKEVNGGYQINVLPEVPQGHTVLEVGEDYVILQDITGITETRIPIYAVRAVTVTRLEKVK